MQRLSDAALRKALLDHNLKSRKRAYAREILRRRYESAGGRAWRKFWDGALFWVGTARASLSRRFDN